MTAPLSLDWLLEPANPSARYLALTWLIGHREDEPEVVAARSAIPDRDPARSILDAQWPAGYWMQPGPGYSPRHKATVWQVTFLAALGAPLTLTVERACQYVLDHSRLPDGRFSAHKNHQGAILCLGGNLVRALFQLGVDDPRVMESLEALALQATKTGFRCRFNVPQAGQPPPARMDAGLPCAWGAIKVLGACARVGAGRRSQAAGEAIEAGVALLRAGDLVTGSYPTSTGISPRWRTFGFPLGFNSDLLEGLEVLFELGLGGEGWLSAPLDAVRARPDGQDRWLLEHTPRNMWASFGRLGEPNKWVTLRALKVLRAADNQAQSLPGAG
jgi:hypothetical protein